MGVRKEDSTTSDEESGSESSSGDESTSGTSSMTTSGTSSMTSSGTSMSSSATSTSKSGTTSRSNMTSTSTSGSKTTTGKSGGFSVINHGGTASKHTKATSEGEALENPGGYTGNFGLIDTHYYQNRGGSAEPGAEDRGGPGASRAEEQKRAQTLKDARTKMATSIHITNGVADPGGARGRNIYVVRNGERLDRLFPEWLELGFNNEGKYRPYDLNHPLTMPRRPGGKEEFRDDGPITEMGYVTSQMVGRAIRLTKVTFAAIYASPALRCVQTAHGILKTLGGETLVRMEPGLFEYTGWYTKTVPKWLTPEEMKRAGYKVDVDYRPVYAPAEIRRGEQCKDHHDRVFRLVRKLMEKDTGNILIVGHGTTLDGIARSLLGYRSSDMTNKTMDKIGSHYPYSSVVALREGGGKWKVVQDALPPVSYIGFNNRVKTDFLTRD